MLVAKSEIGSDLDFMNLAIGFERADLIFYQGLVFLTLFRAFTAFFLVIEHAFEAISEALLSTAGTFCATPCGAAAKTSAILECALAHYRAVKSGYGELSFFGSACVSQGKRNV